MKEQSKGVQPGPETVADEATPPPRPGGGHDGPPQPHGQKHVPAPDVTPPPSPTSGHDQEPKPAGKRPG